MAVRFHVGQRLSNQGLVKGLAGLDVPVEVNPHLEGWAVRVKQGLPLTALELPPSSSPSRSVATRG
jgi:hypothetical protein